MVPFGWREDELEGQRLGSANRSNETLSGSDGPDHGFAKLDSRALWFFYTGATILGKSFRRFQIARKRMNAAHRLRLSPLPF